MIDIPQAAGQDKILEYLDRSIASGRIPHALIISGERGGGKLEIAKAFAKQVLHTDNDEHPDIKIIDLRPKGTRYVDLIRTVLIENILKNPYSGEYKFFIIAGAGEMPTVAQNAILKSLEEPPEYASIIMLTDAPTKLLPTIRSRSIKLFLKPLETSTIAGRLMDMGIDRETANICAGIGMGSMNRAESLANSPGFLEFAETVFGVTANISAGKPIAQYTEEIKDFTDKFSDFLLLVEIMLRDVLVYKVTKDRGQITVDPWFNYIKTMEAACTYDRLGAIRERMTRTYESLRANVSKDVLMELLLVEIGGIN